MDRQDITYKICQFLNNISIPIEEQKLDEHTLLPGILVDRGCILYDPDKMIEPGDLLHEAGHIALMTRQERDSITGNVMSENVDHNSAEVGAILWSYAALKHIGLPCNVVFHDHGYMQDSQWLIDTLESGNYIGLPLLEWNGLTDVKTFPKMHTWISNR